MENQAQQKAPISGVVIRGEPLRLYEHLQETEDESSTSGSGLNASKGWFETFKNRSSLHNIKLVAYD